MAERKFQYISSKSGTAMVYEGIDSIDLTSNGETVILYGEGGSPNVVVCIRLRQGDVVREIA